MRLWSLWATLLRCPQIHRLVSRRAELSGVRDIIGASGWIKARKAARPIEDGEPPVRIFVHPHRGADIVLAVALRRNLQAAPAPGHAVVGTDHTILLDAQHVGERPTHIGHEGRAGFGGRHRKARIVIGYKTILE